MLEWRRLIRGAVGLGIIFSAGAAVVASVIAAGAWLFGAVPLGAGVFRLVAASAFWAFPIGMAFSAFLALSARGRSFHELSLLRFAALGAGGGVVLYGVLAINAWQAWTPLTALANLAIFLGLGAGSAAATLLIARRSAPALGASREADRLGNG